MEPVKVIYCGVCGMPPEYCEFRADFDKCKPWIRENCPDLYPPEILGVESGGSASSSVAKGRGSSADAGDLEDKVSELAIGEDDADGDKKKTKKVKTVKEKKKSHIEPKVVFTLTTRNKRKYVTIVTGIDTIEGVKPKEAAKKFGKKFSSGCSVAESATGESEIHIQGDVTYDLPQVLEDLFGLSPDRVFVLENGREVSVA